MTKVSSPTILPVYHEQPIPPLYSDYYYIHTQRSDTFPTIIMQRNKDNYKE